MRVSLAGWISVGVLMGGAMPAEAQSLSIPDRVAWAEAMLAFEEGDSEEALYLLEDVLAAAGPVPGVLYDAALVSFDRRDYLKAEEYITAVLETDDTAFKSSEDYEDAFRLAASVQRTLRPLRDSLAGSTPLPYTDSLAYVGFGVARRDRNSECEWKFDRGGLIGKYKDGMTCMNGEASSAGQVRIELTVEKRGGGSESAAGIVFGHEDADNYYFLRVHPDWVRAGGDVSLVGVRDRRETLSTTAFVYDDRNRPLGRWSDEGPWRLAVELRGRRIDWFLNGRHVGTEYGDREIRGRIMAAVAGPDGAEFLFRDLSIQRLSSPEGSRR